ncbi:MAG TPA: RNA ligase family protein [Nitrososphaerales archaeon]|nr:RNA ligase family protein [Nitrososphaerales archaeon]
MSDELPKYVQENYAKAVKGDLGAWLAKNPLPVIAEEKYDGIRVFLFKSGDKLVLSSKHGGVYTPKSSPQVFSRVTEFLHAPNRMILDGEYVAREAKGLFLFDVLQVDDRDVTTKPLRERKKILREILHGTGLEVQFKLVKTMDKITEFRDEVVKKGREGIVVKNPESSYGQPNSWLKLKRFDTVDCFVTGIVETPELRSTGIARSWSVAVYDDDGRVVELGNVGSTVERVDPRHVRKGSVIEVRFQEVTRDRKLRAPFILRIRHDKTPDECSLSQIQ